MARTILLADDSVTAQNMGKKILADAGYQVTAVSNGSAALKKIGEQCPDVVVLDVYMPGYSGLEVCRRLKESRDTAGVPVLLTVGKLEPFKAEEATKARADAFIIKPFEATELVAVVKKLEDAAAAAAAKPAPKTSKLKQALSGIQEIDSVPSAEPTLEKEQGWKDRLSIPKRGKKTQREEEPEPEVAEIPAATGFRDLQAESTEPILRDSPFTADPAAAVPAVPASTADVSLDVSPEEIAAIKAAVAILAGEGDSAAVLNVGTAPPERAEEQDSGTKPEAEAKPAAVAPPATEVATATTLDAPAVAKPAEPAAEAPAVESVADAAPKTEPEPAVEVPAAEQKEPEVAATTAASVETKSESAGETTAEVAVPKTEPAPLETAPAPPMAAPAPVVSRWVAELVAHSAEESQLSLAREMEGKRAAVAAAPPIAVSTFREVYSPAPVEDEPIQAELAPPVPEPAAPAAAVAEAAEPVVSAVATEVPAPPAMAAAAGAEVSGPAAPSAVAAQGVSSAPPAAPADEDRDPEMTPEAKAAMAAAWANWHEIRDTVVGSKLAEKIVDAASAVAAAKEAASTAPETSAADNAVPEKPPAPAEAASVASDPTAIASIVDSVLAELKPKIVEEIARKLRKE